jgi:cytochrome c553
MIMRVWPNANFAGGFASGSGAFALKQRRHRPFSPINAGTRCEALARLGRLAIFAIILFGWLATVTLRCDAQTPAEVSLQDKNYLIAHGRYLAIIGVCSACHTPPNVSPQPPKDPAGIASDRVFRTDPDWTKYLDPDGTNFLAGGVPFILRLGSNLSGIVYTTNITPDLVDGIGAWTEQEIADTLREGRRPKRAITADRPEFLYLFPPHSFYYNLSREDALALAYYLKSIPPKKSAIPIPRRQLPAGFEPTADSNPFGPVSTRDKAPVGRSLERAQYLTTSLVGCRECHSHHSNDPNLVAFVPDHQEHMKIFEQGPAAVREYKKRHDWDPAEPFLGPLIPFAGGGTGDPYEGAFRLGPDLPLRLSDKGASLFPYPGFAVLYGENLTEYSNNGPHSSVTVDDLVRAIRQGIAPLPDEYGRSRALSQVMMWPFYSSMSNDDVYSIAEYIKSFTHVPNEVNRLTYYGDDWAGMFTQVFGESPSDNDRAIFGKKISP